ncbi:MAG: class I SAM-dependent methyltransferase [Chloroflexota bacterium]
MLAEGRRGLGFAVGQEPLTTLFASLGCLVVASDLDPETATSQGWVETNQHASALEALNKRGICTQDELERQVTFRSVDMNAIPDDLRGFDFVWSSCSFEHLGSIEKGLQFLLDMMDCLAPGGVAVHTTEFNVFSDSDTIDTGPTVLFRQSDMEAIVDVLRALGHSIETDFSRGDGAADHYIDEPPYYTPGPDNAVIHLKIRIGKFVATSFGLIVQKSTEPETITGLKAQIRFERELFNRAYTRACRLSDRLAGTT